MTVFDFAALRGALAAFPRRLDALVAGIDDVEARRRPDEGGWSVLEIVHHLRCEEQEDFAPRLFATLADPDGPWEPIDPEGRVAAFDAAQATLDAECAAFVDARRANLARLDALDRPDFARTHAHPRLGAISAADLLAAWAAHDALHARQIVKRHWQAIRRSAGTARTDYAGDWTA